MVSAEEEKRAPPDILGVPRAAAVEIVVGIAVMLIVDQVFFGGVRFRDVGPHPFWLLVMVVAAQYGTPAGVFAALLGTLVAFLGNLPPRDPLQNQSAWLVIVLGKPVLWFASAVVLGELRMRQERQKQTLQTQMAELTSQNATLQVVNASLEQTSERLRVAAAGQVQTTVALFEAARTLETEETASIFSSVDGVIRSVLAPTAYSIYLKHGETLNLVAHTNDGKSPQACKRYERTSPLYQAVVQRRLVVHVASPEGQAALAQDGVLAGPLWDGENGEPLGMLKVEALPMTMLRADSLHAFKALCEWIGSAYRKAQRFEEANKLRVSNPGSLLFTDAFYQSVAAFIMAVAERARFDVTQLTIRITLDPAERVGAAPAVREIVEQLVIHGLRTTDLAFDYYETQGEYVVLLPMTPAANCQVVSDRLRGQIQDALVAAGHLGRVAITYQALYVPTPDDVKPWHRPMFRRTAPYEI